METGAMDVDVDVNVDKHDSAAKAAAREYLVKVLRELRQYCDDCDAQLVGSERRMLLLWLKARDPLAAMQRSVGNDSDNMPLVTRYLKQIAARRARGRVTKRRA